MKYVTSKVLDWHRLKIKKMFSHLIPIRSPQNFDMYLHANACRLSNKSFNVHIHWPNMNTNKMSSLSKDGLMTHLTLKQMGKIDINWLQQCTSNVHKSRKYVGKVFRYKKSLGINSICHTYITPRVALVNIITSVAISYGQKVVCALSSGLLYYTQQTFLWYTVLTWYGVGVTKPPFVNFSASLIFHLAIVTVRLFESHSYLTGVTAAELRRHLSNINVIFNS